MKKIFTFLLAFMVYSNYTTLTAQIIFADDFSTYNNAALSGQGSWTNSSSTWGQGGSGTATVSATALSYTGYGSFSKSSSFANGESPGVPFSGTAITSGSVYIAFLVKFSTVPTTTTVTQGQFIRLKDKSGSFSVPGRICVNSSASGNFKFSVTKNATTVTSGTYAVSGTHLVVLKYTVNAGTADDVVSVFINPTDFAVEPSATLSESSGNDLFTTTNQVQGFLVYGSFDSGGTPSGQIGGVRVSSSWSALFPTCYFPNALAASNVSFTSADISWTAPTGGSAPASYNYEVSTSSSFAGAPFASGTVATAPAVPIALTGLAQNTTYYVRVRTDCGGGDLSSYATTSFTTPPTCKTPTSVVVGTTTAFASSVSWAQVAGSQTEPSAWDYELVLSPATYTGSPATPSGVTPAATGVTSPLGLAGLMSNSTYGIKVRANCGASGYSTWTAGNSIFTPASCLTPFSFALSGAATATTATIDWTQGTPNVSGEPTMWEYELSSSSTFTGTPTGTTAKPLNLTGLMGSSSYFIRLRALCGATDKSAWSSAFNFATACGVNDLSVAAYTEGFETTSVGSVPNCWSKATAVSGTPSNNVTSNPLSDPSSSTAYAGTQVLKLGYQTGVQRVLSPTFNASGLSTLELSFYASEDKGFSGNNETAKVQYSINGTTWTDVTTITRINTALTPSNAIYAKRTVVFPPAALSATFQFAFYHTGTFGNNIFIDELRLGSGTGVEDDNLNACTTIATNSSNLAAPINGKNWFRYLSAGGKVVAEINPNGNSFSTVAMQYKDFTAGVGNVATISGQKFLPRYFAIKPTLASGSFPLTNAASVRIYFSDTELADYNTAAGLSKTIAQLGLSKKSEATDDCDPSNNAGVAGTSITPTAVDYGAGFYLEFTTTTFSEFAAVESGVVLAAELTKVTAKKSGDYNRIDWTTASEKDVNRFEIERSANGATDWQTIGSVKAMGNSTAERTYTFDDKRPLSISYYRVRILDNDGTAIVSKTVNVTRSVKALTVNSLSPMPASDVLMVDYAVGKRSKVTVSIVDVLGKTVQTNTFDAAEGANNAVLNLSALTNGTYVLSINDGETVSVKRVVKQ